MSEAIYKQKNKCWGRYRTIPLCLQQHDPRRGVNGAFECRCRHYGTYRACSDVRVVGRTVQTSTGRPGLSAGPRGMKPLLFCHVRQLAETKIMATTVTACVLGVGVDRIEGHDGDHLSAYGRRGAATYGLLGVRRRGSWSSIVYHPHAD